MSWWECSFSGSLWKHPGSSLHERLRREGVHLNIQESSLSVLEKQAPCEVPSLIWLMGFQLQSQGGCYSENWGQLLPDCSAPDSFYVYCNSAITSTEKQANVTALQSKAFPTRPREGAWISSVTLMFVHQNCWSSAGLQNVALMARKCEVCLWSVPTCVLHHTPERWTFLGDLTPLKIEQLTLDAFSRKPTG